MERQRGRRRLATAVLWWFLLIGMVLPNLAFLPFLRHHPNNAQPQHPQSEIARLCALYAAKTSKTNVLSVAPEQQRRTPRAPRRKKRTFNDMLPRLEAFQKKHGHTLVSKEQDPDLCTWTINLRKNYAWQVRNKEDPTGKRSRLKEDKMKQLQNVGFSWEAKRDSERWQTMLAKLTEYKNQHNTTHVDPSVDRSLYDWTKNIRNNYRNRSLNVTVAAKSTSRQRRPRRASDKMKALNDIGFDWEPRREFVTQQQGNTRAPRRKKRTFEDMFPRLLAFQKKHGHTLVPKEQDPDLHNWTSNLRMNYAWQARNKDDPTGKRSRLKEGKMKQLQDIGFVWEAKRDSERWQTMLAVLTEYKNQYNTTHVDPSVDRSLYNWTKNVRNNYRHQALNWTVAAKSTSSRQRRPRLASDRLKSLNDIGFDWAPQRDFVTQQQRNPRAPRRRKRSFEDMLPRLLAFRKKHGHTQVSKEQDPDLHSWTVNLRMNYAWQARNKDDPTGKRSRLKEDKMKQLQAIGFAWEAQRDSERWQTMLVELTEYKNQYNTTHVDPSVNRNLYDRTRIIRNNYRYQALNWTVAAKSTSRQRRPRLAPAKLKSLNDIGFDWGPQTLCWSDMIQRLEAFRAEHGHTRVSKDQDDNDLYRWTQNLVKSYGHQIGNSTTPTSRAVRRPFLSPRRLQQLRELGFDWEQRSARWERSYQELRDYWEQNGHCQVTSAENRKLSVYVKNQRREYRRYKAGNATTLTSERMEALQEIGFEWGRSRQKIWEERHQELKKYYEETGTANIPQKYATNFQLGRWTMNQRIRYRRNGMTEERIRELEQLEFEWNIHQMRWKRMYERLKSYQEKHGHLYIDTSDEANSDLRQWLNEQRHYYKTKHVSRMTEERIDLMESIPGFEWRRRRGNGPSKDDWSDLFVAIREKGIVPGAKARKHWFEGTDRFTAVKTEWTDQELVELWNEEVDGDEDEGEFFEDEESRMFLRA